jgi:hypothetical protein
MKSEEQSLGQQAEKALQAAVKGVIEEARRTNSEVVVWEDGAVRHVPAGELPPTPTASENKP